MKYKKIKKAQQQKSSPSIPMDLVTKKKFKEIVTLLNTKSELKNPDRYLYGYSLLHTQQQIQSLITLWPLAAKGHSALREDCAIIAAQVFKDENFLSTNTLSEEALHILFLAAKNLAPQSSACHTLRQYLFDSLWQRGEFEKLEKILKSNKDEFSSVWLENLSKLAFFQPTKKFINHIPEFVSLVLTGGACLILRNTLYHQDISAEIQSLANEIKNLYSKFENTPGVGWNKSSFENFIDFEAYMLTQALQLAVKNSSPQLEIIPTPSYLMIYDVGTGRVSQKFLAWLASVDKDLFELYQPETYSVIPWILGVGKFPDNKTIINLTRKHNCHPHLRLSIQLRASQTKKLSLPQLFVQLSEFESVTNMQNVFAYIAIQTAKSIINQRTQIKVSPEFWNLLKEFYPVIPDSELKNSLIVECLHTLNNNQYNRADDLASIKNLFQQMQANDLAKQINDLFYRKETCAEFMSTLMIEKNSKKYISAIKNEMNLRAHLILIADTCSLFYAKLSNTFYLHIKSLIFNNKINKIIPLKNNFVDPSDSHCFECECYDCKLRIYKYHIPKLVEQFNLSVAHLPDIKTYSNVSNSKTQIPQPSILLQSDPFKLLDVSLDHSKQIVMQKILKFIQTCPDQMAVYRQAQHALFTPAQRFLNQYLRYLAYDEKRPHHETEVVSSFPTTLLHDIPLRDEFLHGI